METTVQNLGKKGESHELCYVFIQREYVAGMSKCPQNRLLGDAIHNVKANFIYHTILGSISRSKHLQARLIVLSDHDLMANTAV